VCDTRERDGDKSAGARAVPCYIVASTVHSENRDADDLSGLAACQLPLLDICIRARCPRHTHLIDI
jgi:hypothetical protein